MIKKALKVIGILFILIIVAAIAIPYFFKDQIVAAVKEDINKSLNAKVDFEDVNLSLFKSFPDFNFSLDQLSVVGIDEFENYPLVKADNIEFSLDIMSVINSDSPIEINTVSLSKPEINIKVLRNGKANYDIVKPVETTEESADLNFLVQLEKYEIADGQFVYDDRLGDVFVELKDLNHVGKGNFTQDIFDLVTTTQIGSMTASSGGIAYLKKAKTDIDLTLNADIPNSKYTIKDNKINLNALQLNADGFVQLEGTDKVLIDLRYDAPKNKFKNFLSMIPAAYTADFNDVQANGDLKFNGFVKGTYNMTTGALPAFQVNLQVDNADFKYPDLPLGIKGIFATTKIDSPSSDLNKMVVDVSTFKMELGNNPFEASIKLWTLLSDPNIDSKIKGTINLDELSKAFPMEGISKLNGIISSNITAKTSMSAIDRQDYENVDMAGDIRIENMDYVAEGFPEIQIADMQMQFTPKNVKLDKFDAKLGKSDVQAQGTIDNILAYFSPEKTMTGNVSVRSRLFDSNEWMAEPTTEVEPSVTEVPVEEAEIFDRFDFKLDGEIGTLLYDVYELRDSRLVGQVTPNTAEISEFRTKIGESDFRMNGSISNIFNYLYENETMKGSLNVTSNYINLNEFMVAVPAEEPAAKAINETVTTEMEVVLIPEKMDFDINADIKKVLYTNIDLNDINGKVKLANETITMKDCEAKTLGGSFTMNGTYDTQNPETPKFDMDYQVNKFDFQNAFEKLNTFSALAPIGKFIEGQFNTSLKLSGELGKDMMPKLSSLSANGFLQTINSTLKGFAPIEEFANKLNVPNLKKLDFKNTKNWFELSDGKVTLKDFDYSTNGIDMVIGGSHGLEMDMAYSIKAKVPRKLLQANAVGQAADKGLKFLQGQASKLGINIEQGEFINVVALISGTIKDPKVKLTLLGANGEAASLDNLIDNVKDQAIDKAGELIEDKTGVDIDSIGKEVETAKEDLKGKADAEIAALMKKTEDNITKLMKEAEKNAKKTKDEAKKLSDQTRDEGYKQADNLVKEAGGNILKKKAAEIAAKKLKEETDKKADQIITKGDATARGIMDVATKQADNLRSEANKEADGIREKYKEK
jgi:AsmA-like protein